MALLDLGLQGLKPLEIDLDILLSRLQQRLIGGFLCVRVSSDIA
jgi:hypothetical protein